MLVSLQQMKEAVRLTEDADRAASLPATAHNGSRGTFASEVRIAKVLLRPESRDSGFIGTSQSPLKRHRQ